MNQIVGTPQKCCDTGYSDETNSADTSPGRKLQHSDSGFSPGAANGRRTLSLSRLDSEEEAALDHISDYNFESGSKRVDIKYRSPQTFVHTVEFEIDNLASRRSNCLEGKFSDPTTASHVTEKVRFSKAFSRTENADIPFSLKSDEDSSRMHVFCLEHAVEVEQQLRQIGGVHVFLLCHPEYPRIESEAKLVAKELGIDYIWNDILFGDATKDNEVRIRSAIDSEDAIPGNGDWAVKLGINIFYSSNLSRSTLFSKHISDELVTCCSTGRVG